MTEIRLTGPGKQSVILDVDPDDHIGRVILKSQNWYEFGLLTDIHKRTRNLRGIAIDIGAHVGNHSIWMSKFCGLRVMAFEPFQPSYDRLLTNVNRNDVDITIAQYAVGKTEGWGQVIPPREGNSGTAAIEYTNTGNIRTVPVDNFKLNDVRVIKIDVEEQRAPGTISSVFAGARETINRWSPLVYAEGDQELIQSCLPDGYKCFGKFGKTATYGFERKA